MAYLQQFSTPLRDHFELNLQTERRIHIINLNTDVGHVGHHGQFHTWRHPGCGVTVIAEVIPSRAVHDQPVVCETRPVQDKYWQGAVTLACHLQPARGGCEELGGTSPVSWVGQTEPHFCCLPCERGVTAVQAAKQVLGGDAHVILVPPLRLCCHVFEDGILRLWSCYCYHTITVLESLAEWLQSYLWWHLA